MSTTQRAKELSPVTQNNLTGSTVRLSNQLKLLRVTLDAALSSDEQIMNVYRASFFHVSRPTSHSAVVNWGNGKLSGLFSRPISSGLHKSAVYRHVVGKLRQTTTDTKHARPRNFFIEKERPHFTYFQTVQLASDSLTRRLQGISACLQNTAVRWAGTPWNTTVRLCSNTKPALSRKNRSRHTTD